MRLKHIAVPLFAASLLLTACGSNGDSQNGDGSGTFQDDSKSQCFTELNAEQKGQLQQLAADQGNTLGQASNNADGTQDVCVLERASDGSYNEHYYRRDDGFSDYLLYSMMFGRSNALLSYGVLSGDISASDAIVLSMLTGVNSQGMMYHPYSNLNGQWMRSPSVVNNVSVNNVYYGKNPTPTKYSPTMTPPPAYKSTPMPKPSDKTATMNKNGSVAKESSGGLSTIQSKTGSAPGTVKVPAGSKTGTTTQDKSGTTPGKSGTNQGKTGTTPGKSGTSSKSSTSTKK